MTTRKIQKTIYVADDGTEFEDGAACQHHEQEAHRLAFAGQREEVLRKIGRLKRNSKTVVDENGVRRRVGELSLAEREFADAKAYLRGAERSRKPFSAPRIRRIFTLEAQARLYNAVKHRRDLLEELVRCRSELAHLNNLLGLGNRTSEKEPSATQR